ncbi:MAG: Cytochrome c oxidase subunit 7A [Candelaria pacifica]|nr:MAG: Cytochrome c oxidase subunit 7A [Candelaria pacifica]
MAAFPSKRYRPSFASNTLAARYRFYLARHPFLLFGFPFIATMVAGSFFLTPATALRYEKYDRKVRRLNKEEELGIGKNRRRVDMNEEYYRLAAKDIDNWEQKRVKRLPGEHDGIL